MGTTLSGPTNHAESRRATALMWIGKAWFLEKVAYARDDRGGCQRHDSRFEMNGAVSDTSA